MNQLQAQVLKSESRLLLRGADEIEARSRRARNSDVEKSLRETAAEMRSDAEVLMDGVL